VVRYPDYRFRGGTPAWSAIFYNRFRYVSKKQWLGYWNREWLAGWGSLFPIMVGSLTTIKGWAHPQGYLIPCLRIGRVSALDHALLVPR
jgi:hypothetical protein